MSKRDEMMKKNEFNRLRISELEKAIKPIEDFINEYCCPHDVLIVTQGRAELFSGEIGIPLKILD